MPFYSAPNDFAAQKLKMGEGGIVVNKTRNIREIPYDSECVVVPVKPDTIIYIGHIVLCMAGGKISIQRVVAKKGYRYKVGNDSGGVGWTPRADIYGIVDRVK